MYEELIKRLKNCTSDTVEDCAGCPYQGGYKDTYCMNGLITEAADAIEQLSNAGSAYGRGWTLGYDAGRDENSPRWIPVTERLPEEPYGCLAIVWDNPRYDGDMFLNYYPEFVGWDGETWNDADGEEIPFDVVYWMKMPKIPTEPPKEEI